MNIYKQQIMFGWEGDHGLGDMLIRQILDGTKTATCSFKIEYSTEELKQLYENKGKVLTVINHRGEPKCNIRILDIFETIFGNPDIRLVKGEGDGDDIESLKRTTASPSVKQSGTSIH